MQVKRKLRINILIAAVAIIALMLVVAIAAYRLGDAIEQNKAADALITAQFERLAVRTDYIRTGSERAREQVRAKYRQIDGLLKTTSKKFTDTEDQKLISALVENHESIGVIFRTITANRKDAGTLPRSAGLSREIEQRLLNQLDMRVYETVLLGNRLQESANKALVSAFTFAAGGIALVIVFAGAGILLNSWMTGRMITDRIRRLSDGATVIGNGNLDYRIDLAGDDEFSALATAFNAMSEKLRNTYRSLEIEVDVRKEAEAALRESHEALEQRVQDRTKELAVAGNAIKAERQRLYEVLETLPVYVILLTSDYHVFFANHFFRSRFGESQGKRCFEFLFHRTEPCENCETYKALNSNAPHHWYWTGPDGRNYDIYDYPFIDSDGSTLVLEMGIDITDQKQAEQALRGLNTELEQRVLERTAELLATNETLRASRVAALNLMEDAISARKLLEEKSALLGKEILERRRAEDALVALNRGLEDRVFQRTRFYSVLASINGAIVRLREQQSLFDEVCGILVKEGGFKLAWIGLLDRETSEIRAVASSGAISYLEGIKIVVSDVPEGRGPTGTAVSTGKHVANADFDGDANMAPWRDRARVHGIRCSSAFPLKIDTAVLGALTIYSDQPSFFTKEEIALLLALSENISFAMAALNAEKERRASSEALQTLNQELELRVAERTAELEVMNKEMESFIYSVSHDLRAPLRSVSGFSKIIAEDYARLLDELGLDYLRRIQNGAEKMGNLIEDLLNLSRISRQDLTRTKIDLSALASSVIEELQQAQPDRRVETNISPDLIAFCDQRLIMLALSNLLENAWKFTSKKERALITFGALKDDSRTVFFVKDNGAGFDAAYAHKMFLPFHRLHSEQEFEGTGIGLAIVERVIRRHGGNLWAEGEPGKGASFYFTLG